VLKRILTTEGLSFEVKDLMVDEAAAELMDRNSIRTVPVLGINGALHHGDALRPEKLGSSSGFRIRARFKFSKNISSKFFSGFGARTIKIAVLDHCR
jgi:glutaredoxin